jgi:hypothetical protein
MTEAIRAQCLQMVDAMLVQPNAWPFSEPVDPVSARVGVSGVVFV